MRTPFLAAFDFDWTIVDEDSDRWTFHVNNPKVAEKMGELVKKMVWTDAVDQLLGEIHAQGTTRNDILEGLKSIPFNPKMKQVFEWIVEQGGEIAILSDANTVYISTILKHLGMDHLVSAIITNRGFFEESGRLRVERFWKESEEPHGCPNGCAPNLCKGKELKRLMSLKTYERVYYLGDGRNDYCPSVHLKATDASFPRIGRALHNMLSKSGHKVTSRIVPWDSASEILSFFDMEQRKTHKAWIPLESNPEVLNKFAHQLGLPPSWAFTDVWSMDDESLQFIPRPCMAVVFLFPVTEKYESFRKAEESRIKAEGQGDTSPVFFIQQTISNACGTIGLLHALCNQASELGIGSGFVLDMVQKTAGQTPSQRASFLEESEDLEVIHTKHSQSGQTQAPSAEEDADLHFICFIEKNGQLFEMDGRKPFPIHHGPCADILKDSAKVIQSFMARDPDQVNFTILALTPGEELCSL